MKKTIAGLVIATGMVATPAMAQGQNVAPGGFYYVYTVSKYTHIYFNFFLIFLITLFKPSKIDSPMMKCPILNSLISLIFDKILVVL